MLIREFQERDKILAIHKICKYLNDEAWHTTGDADFNHAVEKTKKFESTILKLAKLNYENTSTPIEENVALEDLLGSFELLVEELKRTTPHTMFDDEFLHYYYFLVNKLFPKKAKQIAITLDTLHPQIQEHCSERFRDGHYSDAILAAYKVVLNEIKNVTKIYDLDGKKLVEQAFSLGKPIIKLNALVTVSDRDEQQGFMLLFSGAAVGIRNPKAHELVMQEDQEKALYYLAFASLLLRRLDERASPRRPKLGGAGWF